MIVGLSGYGGSGKSTAAMHLVKNHGFVRLRFGKALYDMLLTLGLDDRHTEGELKEKDIPFMPPGVTPRFLMQTLGTEWARNTVCKDFWIRLWLRDLERFAGADIVVDNVRFQGEMDAVLNMGGTMILMEGRGGLQGSAALHESERAMASLTGFHVVLDNSGSIDSLHRTIDEMVEAAKGGGAVGSDAAVADD